MGGAERAYVESTTLCGDRKRGVLVSSAFNGFDNYTIISGPSLTSLGCSTPCHSTAEYVRLGDAHSKDPCAI